MKLKSKYKRTILKLRIAWVRYLLSKYGYLAPLPSCLKTSDLQYTLLKIKRYKKRGYQVRVLSRQLSGLYEQLDAMVIEAYYTMLLGHQIELLKLEQEIVTNYLLLLEISKQGSIII